MYLVSTKDKDIQARAADLRHAVEQVLNTDHPSPALMRRRSNVLVYSKDGEPLKPLRLRMRVITHWGIHIRDDAPACPQDGRLHLRDCDGNFDCMEFESNGWAEVAKLVRKSLECEGLDDYCPSIEYAFGPRDNSYELPEDRWKLLCNILVIKVDHEVVYLEVLDLDTSSLPEGGRNSPVARQLIEQWFKMHPSMFDIFNPKAVIFDTLQRLITEAIRESYKRGQRSQSTE